MHAACWSFKTTLRIEEGKLLQSHGCWCALKRPDRIEEKRSRGFSDPSGEYYYPLGQLFPSTSHLNIKSYPHEALLLCSQFTLSNLVSYIQKKCDFNAGKQVHQSLFFRDFFLSIENIIIHFE